MPVREEADARRVGTRFEKRARHLVRQDDGLAWGPSGGAAVRRELALTLGELDGLRAEHDLLDQALAHRACALGSARLATYVRYGRYDPQGPPARERLREQQAVVDEFRLATRRDHAQHVRRVHRELLRLLSEHAALEGWGGR